jgi:AmmeMemoRadiSam system protein B
MIRPPSVAGHFYTDDPAELRSEIRSYLAHPEIPLDAKGVIAPHAGYIYSGSVAGVAYGSVRLPRRILVLGPNHTGRGVPLSLYPEGNWSTPLGTVPIDRELNRLLQAECPGLAADTSAHAREHSVEVQIPFLQTAVSAFEFSAICVGTADFGILQSLGQGMARAIRSAGDPVLIVCSSDMNHFEPADVADRKDHLAIEKILSLDARGLYETVIEHDISMCGFAPAVATIVACTDLGATEGRLLRYTNSGEVSGDYESVVAYAAMAIL